MPLTVPTLGTTEAPTPAADSPVCERCAFGWGRCEGPVTDGSREDWGERVIGCLDPSRQRAYLDDLSSIPAGPPRTSPPRADLLPPFIPMIVRGLSHMPGLPTDILYGVSWSVFLHPDGRRMYASHRALCRGLRLPRGARISLVGVGSDAQLEKFWNLSERRRAWEGLAALEPEFATSTTFSVWDEFPRFDQIYNQRRNLWSFDRLLACGVPAVPFLFSATERDDRERAEWLRRHPSVEVVGALAQFWRSTSAFERFVDQLEELRATVGRKFHFLLVGIATPQKISLAFQRLGSVTVATSQPLVKAIRGGEVLPDLAYRASPRSYPREHLAGINVDRYLRFCELAASQSGGRQDSQMSSPRPLRIP